MSRDFWAYTRLRCTANALTTFRWCGAKLRVFAAVRVSIPNGFDGKILAQVLATYPRDELFQCSEDELFANAMAITQIHERRRTRVFLRRDRYGLFYTCLVFMPRDVYNTQLRVRIQELLKATLGAEDAPFDAYFSESILVRLQFIIRVPLGEATGRAGRHRRTAAIDHGAHARLVAGPSARAGAGTW